MFQQQSLTEQQKGVLEDLFFSKLTIQEISKKQQTAELTLSFPGMLILKGVGLTCFQANIERMP